MLAFSNVIGEEVHRQTGENIKRAQKKQHRDYESHNKSSAFNDIYISAEVLLRNNKRKDRKDETPAIAINGWDKLPGEFVEKILILAIK